MGVALPQDQYLHSMDITDEQWEMIHARSRTPHRDRFYVGDMVRLVQGYYAYSYMDSHNPVGCIRKVVHTYIDDHGCRRAWIQLHVPGGKKNRTHGWVAPAFDGYVLHKRAKKNVRHLLFAQATLN